MKRVLIVKTGSSLPELVRRRGDFEDWIRDGLGPRAGPVDVAEVQPAPALPAPESLRAAVVTGSSAMVSERADWSERTAAWLREVVQTGLPVLGICYGHQLLAHALGGRVGPNPRGRQIGTAPVRPVAASADPLLSVLDDPTPLHVTHVECVLELPPGAEVRAASPGDAHHAFAYGRAAWGVQFHPEFDAEIMRGYLEGRRPTLVDEGLDPDALLDSVVEAPAGRRLLRRFAELI